MNDGDEEEEEGEGEEGEEIEEGEEREEGDGSVGRLQQWRYTIISGYRLSDGYLTAHI